MIAGVALTTLRLYRAPIVTTVALEAAFVAVTLFTTSRAQARLQAERVSCPDAAACAAMAEQVQQSYPLFTDVLPLVALLPVVIGAFWGAPLLGREYESGLTKFAWTQSVSRRTWVLGRVAVLGALLAAGGAVMGAAISHWLAIFEPFTVAVDGSDFSFSQARGLNPMGWWLFGFAVGVLAGAVLRRTVPAMAITAAVVFAATIGRNVSFGLLTEGESLSAVVNLQYIEVLVLIIASALFTGATVWLVQQSRA